MQRMLTRYVNTVMIIITVPLTSTVNLCIFYFCRIIGKPTAFLLLQEFNLLNPGNQFHYRRTEFYSQLKSEVYLLDHTLTPHTLKPLASYPRPYP